MTPMWNWVAFGAVVAGLLSGCAPRPCPAPHTAGASSAPSPEPAKLAAPPPAESAADSTPAAARALEFVRRLHGPRRLEVYPHFSEGFRGAVSEAKLLEVLEAVKAQVGNFLDARVLAESGPPARTTLMIAAFYERGTRRFMLTLDPNGVILGAFVTPFSESEGGPGPAPDYVSKQAYSLPLGGVWTVANGGGDLDGNLHVGNTQQWYAFDIHRVGADGNAFTGDAKRKENYHAWGQPVLAPADGTVVTSIGSVPDQEIGSRDHYFVPGNSVVLDHGQGEFSFSCHFQQHSIVVKPGQRVKRGQRLGAIGNSGNTTEPHLHWHLGSDADFTRAHGLPIRFAPLLVNGVRVAEPSLKRGDRVENAPVDSEKAKQ